MRERPKETEKVNSGEIQKAEEKFIIDKRR